jgi:DNA-binding HxlR family transcriptional regulator
METRTVNHRLDDLEHDNNLLRTNVAEIEADNARVRFEFQQLGEKCEKLVRTVNAFVGRFGRVN